MKRIILILFTLFCFNPTTVYADVISTNILDLRSFWLMLGATLIVVLLTGIIRRKIRR